ncbi:MAG: hypothetical protein AAGD00_00525 [Planctomycetota bacterium]
METPAEEPDASMPYESKRLPGIMREFWLKPLIFGAPFCAGVLYVIWYGHTQQGLPPGIGWIIGGVIALWVCGMVEQWWRYNRRRCPTCGARLERVPTARLRYECHACRTLWTTPLVSSPTVSATSGGGLGGP